MSRIWINRQKVLSIAIAVALALTGLSGAKATLARQAIAADEEADWNQHAVVSGYNALGAACYTKSWGQLLYKRPNGTEQWKQQLLPDCNAVRYGSPFDVTSTIVKNGTALNYMQRLGSALMTRTDKIFDIIVSQRYQDGHSKGYQDQSTKSRYKGTSEIDFAVLSKSSGYNCTKANSKLFSANPLAWKPNDDLTIRRKCNSFHQPITVARAGKVVACSLSTAENWVLKRATNFIVIQVSNNNYRPLGKMFASTPLSSIYHYDTYVHVDGIRSTSTDTIVVDGVKVGTGKDAWCNRLLGKDVVPGTVIGLLASANADSPHLHMETVVCNTPLSSTTAFPSGNWKGDKVGETGCRWNRPYWKARVAGQDTNELPRKEFVYPSEGTGNGGWGVLQEPYVEQW